MLLRNRETRPDAECFDSHMRRSPVLCLIAIGLAAPAQSEATTIVSYAAESRSPGVVYVIGSDNANRIVVDRNPQTRDLVITDRRIVAGEGCTRISPSEGVCAVRGELVVEGLGGDDRITRTPSLGRIGSQLLGGPAADEIIGGVGRDYISGGIGDDRLFGKGGSDVISGETGNFFFPRRPGDNLLVGGSGNDELGYRFDTGVDRFIAGPGRDRVNSQDRGVDELIDLGAGQDRCRVDEIDPRAISCEVVKAIRRSAAAS